MRNLLLRRPTAVQFAYQVTVTAAQSTTPKFTFATGAPAALVSWGDGSAYEAVTSDVELTHAYTNAGIYTVQLVMPNQEKWLTRICIDSDKVSKVITQIGVFNKLISFYSHTNAAWSQNISGWVLPPPLLYFCVNSTSVIGNISGLVLPPPLMYFYVNSSSVSGNISGLVLPPPLLYFYINSTSVSGNISGLVLPPPIVRFYVYSTSVSGCPVLSSMVSIQSIQAQNCALPEATVDLYLSRCVAVEAQTTYATPILNLSGTDAAPSNPAGLANKATLVAAGWTVTTN